MLCNEGTNKYIGHQFQLLLTQDKRQIDSEISTIEAPMQPTKIPMPPINTASNQEARGTSRIHKRLAHLRDYVSS